VYGRAFIRTATRHCSSFAEVGRGRDLRIQLSYMPSFGGLPGVPGGATNVELEKTWCQMTPA
jgi:hypothetical protein